MASLAFKPFKLKDHIRATKGEKEGWVTTTVRGFDDSEKILRYDMKAIVKYSAMLTMFCKGTVFTMDNTAVINVAVMGGLGIVTVFFAVIVLAGGDMGPAGPLAELDTKPLETLSSQITAFVPFVLALYVSLTLSRWWALRIAALGKVFDAFANISMIVSCELHDKKWQDLRNQISKYGFASVQLLIQAARQKEDMQAMLDYGYLTTFEVSSVRELTDLWQRPMILWAWIMRICVSAFDHNKSPAPRSGAVMAECIQAREGMATINTYLDTQLPFAYVHLITLLVNVQNIVISLKAGFVFATAIPGQEFFKMTQQVLTLILICFIYQALLQISYMILDPFGDDVLDFPMKAYGNYLAAIIDAMMEAQPQCPVVAEDGTLYRPRPKKARSNAPASEPGDSRNGGSRSP